MSFLSSNFMLWVAAVVILYLPLPRQYQMHFVSLATFAFLLTFSPWSALTLVGMLGVSYFVMQHWSNRTGMVLLVIFCISSLLVVYKYLLRQVPSVSGQSPDWLLLGASFYVLRVIHYIIERYKGTLQRHGFTDYLNYMLFLPMIVVGPINRFDEFLREQRRRRWDSQLFAAGLERILYGYVKVVLFAGYFVNDILHSYTTSFSARDIWLPGYLSCLEYGLDLYFKFSGYSDIAIGFALLLGIRVSENFHYPFLQPNIARFWKSWHISLSSWCRDYVYMPIAAQYRRPFMGIIASMLILGLWHELSTRYVLWGIYHGLGIAAWQYFQHVKPQWLSPARGPMASVVHGFSIFITFNFVVLSFQITKSVDIASTIMNSYNNLMLLLVGG